MDEKHWLDGYSGQTTDELLSLRPSHRADSLVLAFEAALGQKEARQGLDTVTEAERTVLAVEALEREVNNGGYRLFLSNSSREHAPCIVDALRRIGRPAAADLTRDALGVLGLAPPFVAQAVEFAMQKESRTIDEALDACDQRYFQVVGDLSEPLLDFIAENRDRISLQDDT